MNIIPDQTYNFGRIIDNNHVEQFLSRQPHSSLYQANPLLRDTANDVTELLLWDAELAAKGTLDAPAPDEQVRPPHNQLKVGICTGEGNTGAAEDLLYVQIGWKGQPKEFQWLSCEAIYGGGRVVIGKNAAYGGDGAATSWLIEYGQKFGLLPRKLYTLQSGHTIDLSTYTETNAQWFGNHGVPQELVPLQADHKYLAVVQPTSIQEIIDGMRNGCPMVAGSSQGFTTTRDSKGFCTASGRWDHCTYWRGYILGPRPGLIYQQSWGPNMPTGSKQVTLPSGRQITLPEGAFFVDFDVVEKRILSAKDCYILSDEQGFPSIDYRIY